MGKLVLSGKEKKRLELLARVKRGEITLGKAAALLQVSYRQGLRIFARYQATGAAGLAHRLRGRRSNRQSDEERRTAIVRQYRACYADFGPTLAAEYLAKDGLPVPVQTLRRWLVEEGLWQVTRPRPTHRRWRPRKECFGEMVQMDGSHHDWFEGRRGWAVLMVMVDDATNYTYARFFEAETTESSLTMAYHYFQQHGLPRSFYVDRDSIYRVNRDATVDEALAGEAPMTQFGRAMNQLGVELICAHSAQAKGRVERRNGILQDRLVKALRLQKIATLEEANRFLDDSFLKEFNERFQVPAPRSADVHRRVPRTVDLALVLSCQEERVVGNDWTIQWRNRWFQLTAANRKLRLVKQRILVCEQLDGRIRLRYRGRDLEWVELPERPRCRPNSSRGTDNKPAKGIQGDRKGPWKPRKDHPWRRGL